MLRQKKYPATPGVPGRSDKLWQPRNARIALGLAILVSLLSLWVFFTALVTFPKGACTQCTTNSYSGWMIIADLDGIWGQASGLGWAVLAAFHLEVVLFMLAYVGLARQRVGLVWLNLWGTILMSMLVLAWIALVAVQAYSYLIQGLNTGASRQVNLSASVIVISAVLNPICALVMLRTRVNPEYRADQTQYSPNYRRRRMQDTRRGDI